MRRFRAESLASKVAGDSIELPEAEAKHARVLRLQAGQMIEVFDDSGINARAKIISMAEKVQVEVVNISNVAHKNTGLILAVAWPKGKRAATMVEKCAELGVTKIIPVAFSRSVVSKDEESEGVARLRRIAAEAAKQSGRSDVPEIAAEMPFARMLNETAPEALALLLDPRAERGILDVIQEKRAALLEKPLLMIVGPEGGIADEEIHEAEQKGIVRVRLAENVLRVETAALAACAVAGAALI
jgi:16S rRNA (uracil1498-N3)-methyltransferase